MDDKRQHDADAGPAGQQALVSGMPFTADAHSRLEARQEILMDAVKTEIAELARRETPKGYPLQILPVHVDKILEDLPRWVPLENRERAEAAEAAMPRSGEFLQSLCWALFGAFASAVVATAVTGLAWGIWVSGGACAASLAAALLVWRRRRA